MRSFLWVLLILYSISVVAVGIRLLEGKYPRAQDPIDTDDEALTLAIVVPMMVWAIWLLRSLP